MIDYYKVWNTLVHMKPEKEDEKEAVKVCKSLVDEQMSNYSWRDAKKYRIPYGKSIVIFTYDGVVISGYLTADYDEDRFYSDIGKYAIPVDAILFWKLKEDMR